MKQNFIAVFILLALTSWTAFAAGIASGTYSSNEAGRGPTTLTITVNGNQASGTLTRGPQAVAITGGTVNGNNISFNVQIAGIIQNWAGSLSGTSLNLTISTSQGSGGNIALQQQ